MGLSIGLLLGSIGAVVILYLPRAIEYRQPGRTRPPARTARPGAPSPKPASNLAYEENHLHERRIKQIEQEIYRVLRGLQVREESIQFAQVARRTRADREWEHTRVDVSLPAGLSAEKAARDIEKAVSAFSMSRADLAPEPGGRRIQVFVDDLPTHVLHLREDVDTGAQTVQTSPPQPQAGGTRPKVVLVIDDFGMSMAQARCFLDLDLPLAYSILPFQAHSRDVARLANDKGRLVMLHLPMQPAGFPEVDPGPGALLVSMDRSTIEQRVREAVNEVPFIRGVNNHMGSRFTEDRERMGWVLEVIKAYQLFYLDSWTSSRSKALSEARRLGLPSAKRTTFLDNIQEPDAVRIQLRKLVARARRHGWAIGIGHPYPVTCQVLKTEYNELNTKTDLVLLTDVLR